jgi:kinesin family protein C1
VIAALGSREQCHIPYRNSKLTWLLQPCLGGDAKMLMIANVAPTVSSASESLCSLRFAAKVNATDIGIARRSTAFAKS